MKKTMLVIGFLLVLASLLLLTGCWPKQPESQPSPLFNESLNQQIENLTVPTEPTDSFVEFMFNYTARPEAKYEIARDDIFTMSMGNFTSSEISFFGVMLGDSYESVLERLGIPDVMYIPADESYKNLEYRKKIGIGGQLSGLTLHIENNTVTRINVKPAFNKYLQGNTSLGTSKEIIYIVLDIPDYQSFVSVYRVFHYVEKGVELYFKGSYVNRMSFFYPSDFKGVEYINVVHEISDGVFANVTEVVAVE